MVTASAIHGNGLVMFSFVKRKKFQIAISAAQRRLNYFARGKTKFHSRPVYFRNHARVLIRVANNASLAYFAAANFKLRLDQHNQTTVSFQKWN
jgi:hypothetical protein